jgi:hypothetical protein
MKYIYVTCKIGLALILASSVSGQTLKPPPMKRVNRAQRAEWLNIINWPTDCEEAFQNTYASEANNYGGLRFYQLRKQTYLVEIVCYRGAYQPGSILAWYNAQTKKATLLKFKGIESDDEAGKKLPYSEISGFVTWNRKTHRLEIFSKYRGPGDCGFWGQYKFNDSQPVLIVAREQDCDETHIRNRINPRYWPKKKL